MIVLIPAMIFTMFQARIKRAFSTHILIENSKGITGFEAARTMLDAKTVFLGFNQCFSVDALIIL